MLRTFSSETAKFLALLVPAMMRGASERPEEPASPVDLDLLRFIEDWRQLVESLHTYKFACIEAGNREAFELLDALQRREQAAVEELQNSVRRLIGDTKSAE